MTFRVMGVDIGIVFFLVQFFFLQSGKARKVLNHAVSCGNVVFLNDGVG